MSGGFSLADFFSVEQRFYGRPRRGLARWDARLKLLLTAVAVLANVLWPRRELSLALAGAAWLGLLLSRSSLRQALVYLLAPLWTTTLVVLGFSLGFGRTPLLQWGPLVLYREGLSLGVDAAFRVLAEVSWVAALMLSTPFTEILAALRWLRVPGVAVDVLAAMYRYIFLLFEEYKTMAAAAKSRGGFVSYPRGLATLGQITAQGFLRALERAERIDMAMRARGRDAVAGSAQAVPGILPMKIEGQHA